MLGSILSAIKFSDFYVNQSLAGPTIHKIYLKIFENCYAESK
jgi:hypothetical protein